MQTLPYCFAPFWRPDRSSPHTNTFLPFKLLKFNSQITNRKCIRQCKSCFKFRAHPYQPKMADLPASRVSLSCPFASTGLDFAGSFIVRETKLRKFRTFKGFLCLFVCNSTRAIHLEFVSELSTSAFLAALIWFCDKPRSTFSDHLRSGSQFCGKCTLSLRFST